MVHVRGAVVVASAAVLAGAGCSGGASREPAKPDPGNVAARGADDGCERAVDKLFAVIERAGRSIDPGLRDGAIEDCRKRAGDPLFACINAAPDDAAVHQCMTAPKGEPYDDLERAVT